MRRRIGLIGAWLDRRRFAHWVVLRALPRAIALRFDRDVADDLQATFELAVRNPRSGDATLYALAIADQRCRVRAGPARRPGARAAVRADDLILLASGAASWPELLSSGRFELSGDPFLALRFAALFRLAVMLDPV